MSQNPPTTLGKYHILREIARSNDIVYEGYDPQMNRRVALKELNIPPSSTPAQREERIRRFRREVKAAGSLAHPNIVTIYEVEETDGRHWMAMEYLDGCTLRNLMDTQGLIAPDRALEIADAVLQALEFSHKNGVIHRDIKPENIQILSTGQVKLTDFGIARLTFEPNITMDGQVFGTPSYMSPEQVVGKDLDARSDLFSVGSVLHEMLSGQKAFPGDSVVSISYAIMNHVPSAPATASLPVQALLRQALEKVPALRFNGATEMLRSVREAREALRQPPVSATPAVNPYAAYPMPYPPAPPPTGAYPPLGQGYPPGQAPYGAAPPTYSTYRYPGPGGPPPSLPFTPRGPMVPSMPPLLSGAAKRTLAAAVASALTIGLLFAVVVAGVSQMGRSFGRVPQGAPPSVARDSNTAAQWDARGVALLATGRISEAIEAFENARLSDPQNPAHAENLGLAKASRASSVASNTDAMHWFVEAAEDYSDAIPLTSDPARQRDQATNASTCFINAAERAIRERMNSRAREWLIRARDVAPRGSEVRRDAESRLAEIS